MEFVRKHLKTQTETKHIPEIKLYNDIFTFRLDVHMTFDSFYVLYIMMLSSETNPGLPKR